MKIEIAEFRKCVTEIQNEKTNDISIMQIFHEVDIDINSVNTTECKFEIYF